MGSHLLQWLHGRIIDWLVVDRASTEMPLCDFGRLRVLIQPGDVLLVEGRSRVSEIIKLVTQSPWSHAALYIGSADSITDPEIRAQVDRFYSGDPKEQLLIEALMDKGVVITPLAEYRNQHLRICRPKGLSPWDARKVLHFAACHLGCTYDFRQILDLARFLLPYGILPRRLGSSLFQHNAGASTRAVCSSMLARSFMSVHFPIIPVVQRDASGRIRFYHRNFRLFTPRDFDVSPYFEIIKYPLLGQEDMANYRNLPWGEDGLVCNTAGDCFSTVAPAPEEAADLLQAAREFWQRARRVSRRLLPGAHPIPVYPVVNLLTVPADSGHRASVPLSPAAPVNHFPHTPQKGVA